MRGRALAVWVGVALCVGLLSTNPAPRALLLIVALNVCLTTALPGRSLRPLLVASGGAAVLAAGLNGLLSHTGSDVLATVPGWVPAFGGALTAEGFVYGAGVGLGLAAVLLSTAPLGLALEPHELIAVLPRGLERTGTALATALTLVPALGTSFTAVREAQRLRGAPARGVRSWAGVLTPVAVGAMERSLQVAESMEARGYGSGRRTRYPSPRARGSAAIIASALLALTIGLGARLTGHNPDWLPYPRPATPSVDVLALLAPLLLLTPTLLWQRPTSAG